MNNYFFVFGCFFIYLMTSFTVSATDPKINILQLTSHPALDNTVKGIVDQLEIEGYSNFRVRNAMGDLVVANQIAKGFISENPLCIISIATNAALVAKSSDKKGAVPIFFSSVTDPEGAGLLKNFESPEANVTGVSNFVDIDLQLQFYTKLLPNMKKLGIIYNSAEPNSIKIIKELSQLVTKYNIELVSAVAINTIEVSAAASKLADKAVDAIFISNDNNALSAFNLIVKIATRANIPVLVSDNDLINEGALAGFGPNQYQIGRQTAQMVIKFLRGTAIDKLPVEFPNNPERMINLEVAKKLRINIPKEVLQLAEKTS